MASQPLNLLAAPSSCSMYSSAFCRAAASMSALSWARSAGWSLPVMPGSIQLDALFGEVLHRAGMPGNGRGVLLLVLQLEVLGLLVHRHDLRLLVEDGLDDVVGRLLVHGLAGDQDVLHGGLLVVVVHAAVRLLRDRVLHVQVAV